MSRKAGPWGREYKLKLKLYIFRCVVYDLFVRLTEAGFVTNRFRSRNVVRNDEGEYRLIDFGNMDNDDYNRDDRLARAMEDLNIYYEDYEAFKRGEL